jgi:hypothetical protein
MLLGTTDAAGNILSSLPGGIWKLSVTDSGGNYKTLDGGVLDAGVSYVDTPSLTVTAPETSMIVRVT